jgi:SAM-dependent MidA family methyltransferase
VEAGAGNGRLSRDILDAAARDHPQLYRRMRVTLVERSTAARAAQREMLEPHADRVVSSRPDLPHGITGVLLANELLDAFPVHVVTMTSGGWQEIYVSERAGALIETMGPLSTSGLRAYLDRVDVNVRSGWRGEAGLAAERWMFSAAAALERGFVLLFDFGHEAAELFSATHANGTLVAYREHTTGAIHWLAAPGECDLCAHVNLTAVRIAAEAAGLTSPGMVDQTYFLISLGIVDRVPAEAPARTFAAKTLIVPGGLGSTIKVLAFAKNVGQPELRGFSSGRLT